MAKLKKAFFDHIRERLHYLDLTAQGQFVNLEPPDRLYLFIEQVGGFLIEYGALVWDDIETARGMAEEYQKRLEG